MGTPKLSLESAHGNLLAGFFGDLDLSCHCGQWLGRFNRLFVPPFRSMLNCWYAAIHWFMPWFMAFWCRIGDCSIVKPNKILWFNYPLPTVGIPTFNCSVSGAPTQDASGEWRFGGKPKPKEKMPSSWVVTGILGGGAVDPRYHLSFVWGSQPQGTVVAACTTTDGAAPAKPRWGNKSSCGERYLSLNNLLLRPAIFWGGDVGGITLRFPWYPESFLFFGFMTFGF